MDFTSKLVNLTPHEIGLALEDQGVFVVVPPSGTVARVASTPGAAGRIPGVPVPVMGRQVWGAVTGLPDPVEGVTYIVSAIVLGRPECLDRDDVVGPGTGPNDGAIRFPPGHPRAGQVEAVTRLVRG